MSDETKKPSRWKRFGWWLERALGSTNTNTGAGYTSERFRADMYNGTDGGSQ